MVPAAPMPDEAAPVVRTRDQCCKRQDEREADDIDGVCTLTDEPKQKWRVRCPARGEDPWRPAVIQLEENNGRPRSFAPRSRAN